MAGTLDNALQRGAEVVAELAKETGKACGIPGGTEACIVLERALAIAWADVALFLGANDTPERLNEAIKLMQKRIADEMRLQHFNRLGTKPFTKGH